jgi:hypothetical protein
MDWMMMTQLTLSVLAVSALFAALAAVHLFSGDADRRRRALRLIKLLLGR